MRTSRQYGHEDLKILPDMQVLSKDELQKRATKNSEALNDLAKNDSLDTSFPLIHATTLNRAVNILESGKIKPYSQLLQEGNSSVSDNIETYTDVLDQFIGTDTYMFASLGKAQIRDDNQQGNVFFMFDPQIVAQQKGVIISVKEIAELGGIVSREGASVHMSERNLSEEDIQKINRKAIGNFYEGVLTWEGFKKIFIPFLKEHPNFLNQITYGSEEIDYGTRQGLNEVRNYWQGYQFMIPEAISIADAKTIVCTDKSEKKKLSGLLSKRELKGPNRVIYTLDEMRLKFNTIFGSNGEITEYNTLLINTFLYLLHNRITSTDKIIKYLEEHL